MKLLQFLTVFLFISGAVTLPGLAEQAEAQILIPPDPDSEIRIEGRSNVNSFTCNAERYEGGIEIRNERQDPFQTRSNKTVSLELHIPVLSLECGRNRMNRDMYNALKSDNFAYISFEFIDARALPGDDTDGEYPLEISGTLTVAGTANDITFTATGYLLENNRMRVTGQKEIRMTDYNVDPPSGLFGLIRAEDELIVHFDLFASPDKDFKTFGEYR